MYNLRLSTLLLLGLSFTPLFGCFANDSEAPATTALPKHATFTNLTGVELPGNSHCENAEDQSGIDLLVQAKCEATKESFNEWIKTLSLKPENFSVDRSYQLSTSHGWWDPESYAPLPTATVEFENNKFMHVGYSDISATDVVFFVVFHGI